MEKIFKEIISIDGVIGVVLIGNNENVEYSKFADSFNSNINIEDYLKDSVNFQTLTNVFDSSNESLIIYDEIRLYAKKILNNYLIIAMKLYVPISLLRLNCQIVEAELGKKSSSKRFKLF